MRHKDIQHDAGVTQACPVQRVSVLNVGDGITSGLQRSLSGMVDRTVSCEFERGPLSDDVTATVGKM